MTVYGEYDGLVGEVGVWVGRDAECVTARGRDRGGGFDAVYGGRDGDAVGGGGPVEDCCAYEDSGVLGFLLCLDYGGAGPGGKEDQEQRYKGADCCSHVASYL